MRNALLIAALLLAVVPGHGAADANPLLLPPDDAVGPVLALGRLCVNESGLRAYTYGDCAAIHQVILFRQERVPAYRGDSYAEALHRYSRGAVLERGRRGRPWIVDLWPDAREPAGYCSTCRWSGRGEVEWLRTMAHAAAVFNGDLHAWCRPHTWASAATPPRDATVERVDCGNTLNAFYVVPRYLARWGLARLDAFLVVPGARHPPASPRPRSLGTAVRRAAAPR